MTRVCPVCPVCPMASVLSSSTHAVACKTSDDDVEDGDDSVNDGHDYGSDSFRLMLASLVFVIVKVKCANR